MPRIWAEQFDASKHQNQMPEVGVPLENGPHSRLQQCQVYFVSVCSFTFQFHSVDQILACLSYYQTKLHPSSRRPLDGGDHWEHQLWNERLPLYLREEAKRQKVIKALEAAVAAYGG